MITPKHTADNNRQVIADFCVSELALLGKLLTVTPILPSFRNQSFQLRTSRGLFILRLHHKSKTPDDIKREEQIINHARRGGISIPALLGSFPHAGGWITVQEWVDGNTISTLHLTSNLAYRAGLLLAEVHHVLADFTPKNIAIEHHHSIEDRLAEQIAPKEEQRHRARKLAQQADWLEASHHQNIEYFFDLSAQLQASASYCEAMPPLQYLHGDFNPRNIFLTYPRWMVLDWEDSFWGDRSFDIAKALLFLCGFPEVDFHQPMSLAFLAGYKARSGLSLNDLVGVFWQARFVVATDVSWLLVSLTHHDARRLAFLQRDCERLKQLLRLETERWFARSSLFDFYQTIKNTTLE